MNLMRTKKNGFTLMELLLVIGILGILSVISFSSILGAVARGRDSQRKSDIALLKKAVEQYANDVATYPVSDGGSIKACGDILSPTVCVSNFSYTIGTDVVTPISKFPADPSSGRSYYYIVTTDGYALYAALENINDKDVKADIKTNTDGWDVVDGVDCGVEACNYKVTNSGLEK